MPFWKPTRPNWPKFWCTASWLLLAAVVALMLCKSAFFYGGQKVDESEIVMNAVAIAGGGWQPQWSGYGHLGMYIAAAALALSLLALQVMGMVSSYADGIYLLFQNDGAYRIIRFVYALADVLTALLLANVIIKITGQRLVAVLFFFGFLLSADTWFYANYIRVDSLVSLFVAVAIYALASGRARSTPYVVGLAIGAAIACKYSALVYLALVVALAIDEPDRPRSWKQRVSMMAVAMLVAIIAAFALQPRYNFAGVLSAAGNHLSGEHFTSEANSLGDRVAMLGKLALSIESLAWLFMLSMWLAVLHWRRSAGLLLATLVGILPFAVSNFPREYWLLPFADAVRAAGWLGIACLVEWIRGRVGPREQRWVTVGLLVLAAGILWVDARTLAQQRKGHTQVTNRETARRWLYVNAANRVPLTYSYEKNYILPRAYSFGDYRSAASFSRVFIFKREKFDSLHTLFERRLYEGEYRDFSESTKVPQLRISLGSGTAAQVNGNLRLCSGDSCYKPKRSPCNAAQAGVMGRCFTYSWDMDKPALKSSLRDLKLRVGAPIPAYALCWYTCGKQGAPLTRARLSGEVELVSLGSQLFAPTRMASLDKIAESGRLEPGEYLVTSPTAYVPWLKKIGALGRGGKQAPSKVLAQRLHLQPVQRFNRDSGPVIEVYMNKAARKQVIPRASPALTTHGKQLEAIPSP